MTAGEEKYLSTWEFATRKLGLERSASKKEMSVRQAEIFDKLLPALCKTLCANLQEYLLSSHAWKVVLEFLVLVSTDEKFEKQFDDLVTALEQLVTGQEIGEENQSVLAHGTGHRVFKNIVFAVSRSSQESIDKILSWLIPFLVDNLNCLIVSKASWVIAAILEHTNNASPLHSRLIKTVQSFLKKNKTAGSNPGLRNLSQIALGTKKEY